MDVVRTILTAANLGGKDPDHIVELCDEVVFLYFFNKGLARHHVVS